jgi:hypothetical protein
MLGLLTLMITVHAFGQQSVPVPDPAPAVEPEPKRLLWIIPNFRTAPVLANYRPITPSEKFKIATLDAFDRGTVALALAVGGVGQLSNSNPSFGQGVAGYAHYAVTSYSDYVIGDFMTESVFPTILHQDPRYFRRGIGSTWSRLGYSIGQTFWTHNDSGKGQFNFSEIGGNSAAVAIGMSYYPDNRTAGNATKQLGIQLGIDTGSNILKEFWPDLQRKLSRKPKGGAVAGK